MLVIAHNGLRHLAVETVGQFFNGLHIAFRSLEQ